MHTHLPLYESAMAPARAQFQHSLMNLLPNPTPQSIGRFLYNFCVLGVGMTKEVPNWIRRAGEKTSAMGMTELGEQLVRHAHHENGHHELFEADAKALSEWWKSTFPEATLTSEPPFSPGVIAYQLLHEDYIGSETPYCQIAIEYEIEKVSVDYGPMLFGKCAQVAGPAVVECLSFVKEHTLVDVGHTKYNAKALDKFLAAHPSTLQALISAGTEALACYSLYLQDCARGT